MQDFQVVPIEADIACIKINQAVLIAEAEIILCQRQLVRQAHTGNKGRITLCGRNLLLNLSAYFAPDVHGPTGRWTSGPCIARIGLGGTVGEAATGAGRAAALRIAIEAEIAAQGWVQAGFNGIDGCRSLSILCLIFLQALVRRCDPFFKIVQKGIVEDCPPVSFGHKGQIWLCFVPARRRRGFLEMCGDHCRRTMIIRSDHAAAQERQGCGSQKKGTQGRHAKGGHQISVSRGEM